MMDWSFFIAGEKRALFPAFLGSASNSCGIDIKFYVW